MDELKLKPGAIVRIKLENFMTFTECEFKPGPRMNVILGPNGSGKSSLICAIGLGLGGAPKILGRSGQLRDFIKKGEDSARIEIELFGTDGGENTIIERTIEDKTSKWRLNRKNANDQQVQKVLRNLEIQVDNLVQFLPQDKVAEFSQFDEFQLLRETIRAVLGSAHLDMQSEISARQKEVESEKERLDAKKKLLTQLSLEHEAQQHVVTRQRDRKQLLLDIELLQKKLPWIKFEDARDRAIVAKTDLKQMEQDIKNGSKLLEPLRASNKEMVRACESAKRELDRAQAEHKPWALKMDEYHREMTDIFEKIDEEKETLVSVDQQKAKAQRQVEQQQAKVAKLEQDLAGRKGDAYYDGIVAGIKVKMDPLSQEDRDTKLDFSKLSADLTRKNRELETLKRNEARTTTNGAGSGGMTAQRMKELEEEKRELIQTKLKVGNADKAKMIKMRQESMQGNSTRFKSKVIGPLISELRASDSVVGKVLEYSLRPNTWKFFVVTNSDDQQILMNDTERLSCMLIQGELPQIHRPFPKETLEELGVRGYLDQLLVCDPLAVEAARRLNRIDHVLVGTDATDRLYNTNPKRFTELLTPPQSNFNEKLTLVTPTARIELSRSRYGAHEIQMKKSGLDSSRLFDLPLDTSAQDAEKMQRETQAMQAGRAEMFRKMQELEREVVSLDEQVRKIQQRRDVVTKHLTELKDQRQLEIAARDKERQLDSVLRQAQDKLVQYEKDASQNWERKAQKAKAQLEKLKQEAEDTMKATVEASSNCTSMALRITQCQLTKAQVDLERHEIQQMLKEEEHKVNNATAILQKKRQDVEDLLKLTRELKLEAERICPMTPDSEYLQMFQPLPDTVDDIQMAIDTKQSLVDRIFEDATAMAEFEKRAEKIKSTQAFIDANSGTMEDRKSKLMVEVENWVGPVKGMAEDINGKIKLFFKEINKAGYECAGEVALKIHNSDDITTCGMEIQVKFRQEQNMSKLDATIQSGGERSLTTFLYMLALQELSAVPFRVVDEINQGMDPDKERLAFYRLAEVSSRATSQYFLATPKLLPGLAFPKDATILFVFNGPYSLQQKEWDMTKFLTSGRNKRLSLPPSTSPSTTSSSSSASPEPTEATSTTTTGGKRVRIAAAVAAS